MESYSIPEHIKPVAFLIKNSQIDGRLDPNYNRLKIEVEQELAKSIYSVKRIKDVLSRIQYGTSSLANTEGKGVPIIRMNNIQDDDLDLTDIKHIELSPKEIDNISLNKGDILFNRTNSKELVGKCVVFNENEKWVYASYIIRVVLDKTEVLPKYASYFLNARLGRLQVDCISRQIAGMTNINAEEIKSLKLIVPPIKKQEEFVAIIDEAKKKKFELKKQASDTLDGIDSYILNELGIILPEKDSSIEARMFQTTFQELSGRRFDPSFHSYDFSLESTLYSNCPVLDLVDFEPGWKKLPKPETEVSFVPMDAVDDKIAAIVGTETRIVANAKGYTRFQEGDILWAKITPCMQNGKSTIAANLKNRYGYGSTEFYVLRCHSTVDPDYLLTLLRLKELRNCATLYFGGASGHQRVSPSFFKDLVIPIPPIEKQKEIGQEANRRRFEAQRLSIEADKVLEEARAEIEQMILNK